MGYYFLELSGNIENLLRIPNCEITEYISALLLLLSTISYTGFDQEGIHNS